MTIVSGIPRHAGRIDWHPPMTDLSPAPAAQARERVETFPRHPDLEPFPWLCAPGGYCT